MSRRQRVICISTKCIEKKHCNTTDWTRAKC